MRRILLIALLFAAPLNAAAGKTWALLIGISQYDKLPQDLWLQFPERDAQSFHEFLASPQGGSVPAGQILLLTNQKATTAAVRAGLTRFLKEMPGRDDTVYVLIAGHGTVDETGAYILTFDSDPRNLAATALPMGELHTVIEEELHLAARVILLADVCRAASIAGQKTAAIGASVEKIGEAPGEMLGLMAARPKELSIEGPDFGGGHGAFTWSVLQGLAGSADADHDGAVSAGELIDYVTTAVPKLTAGRQHPRDFGNMDNATKLSSLGGTRP